MKRRLALHGILFSLISCASSTAPTPSSLSPDAVIFPLPESPTETQPGDNPWLTGFGASAATDEVEASAANAGTDPTESSSQEPPHDQAPASDTTTETDSSATSNATTTSNTTETDDPSDHLGLPDHSPQLRLEEYMEGEGSDKVLSFSNTGAGTDGSCNVEVYVNGGTTPWRSMALSPLPAPGKTGSYCSAVVTGRDCLGEISGSTFNGNDALVVRCNGELSDSFGQVGYDPGAGWGSELGNKISTKDSHWLRCTGPDQDASDPFVVDDQWIPYPQGEDLATAQLRCSDNPLGLGGTPEH